MKKKTGVIMGINPKIALIVSLVGYGSTSGPGTGQSGAGP